jgi:hypothetical protein
MRIIKGVGGYNTKMNTINIKEIKGLAFKKEFGLVNCLMGYHNKNTNGGNFGLNFRFEKEFNPKADFSLNGNYDKEGNLLSLSVWSIRIGEFGFKLRVGDLNSLKTQLHEVIKRQKNDTIVEELEK